ncbi:cytochrome P450 [Novosphingobium sp. 9U]|uniref:cytochrome P450 n=1 Tax=Novosphingobium sp. 9U TaxID=2653158 RepID=UPI0012F03DD8|nr:cytochrome P450 [Novosphingobium sp. 9U]VWX53475.1 conserved hypothetical protein [Novosphingobium sp. 9U]
MNQLTGCPIMHGPTPSRDDRKSAAIAAENLRVEPGARVIASFPFAREILRSSEVRQAGAGAEHIKLDNPEHVSVFFLDGELHKKRRSQLARYFTPKAIRERHEVVMRRTTDALIAELHRDGRAQLDLLSMRLACDVAAEIVGLTASNPQKLADRIRKTFDSMGVKKPGPLDKLRMVWRTLTFMQLDVMPAVKARRKAPREDVISYCVQEGFSNKAILIEGLTYATAGMLTTREFIVMVAWHLFDNDPLRARFLDGGEEEQLAILDEILRLEPVAAMVYRKAAADFTSPSGETVRAGELYGVSMRQVNTDEAVAGECPFALEPGRAKRQKVQGNWMSFGDGPHRCPGAQVALHETRVFLDALLRVPGVHLATQPTIGWCAPIMGYEVHGAVVACERG